MNKKYKNYTTETNRILYWMSLLVLTISNFVISIVLIPFLLTINNYFLYIIIILLGIIFGSLFELLIEDIEHLNKKHHAIALIFIPAIAIINIFVTVNIANNINQFLKFNIIHEPIIISAIYVISFLTPYIIGRFKS